MKRHKITFTFEKIGKNGVSMVSDIQDVEPQMIAMAIEKLADEISSLPLMKRLYMNLIRRLT